MAKAKAIKLDVARTWTWYPPNAELPARDYAREIMRDARRFARGPAMLEEHATGCLTMGYAGYVRGNHSRTVALGAMVGGGWGSSQRAVAAEWAGGKSWLIRDAARGRVRDALDKLRLPEEDGRLLLIGAPARPAKGVTAWRTRWTVNRKQAEGLVAVAGEGIDPRSFRERIAGELETYRARAVRETHEHERASAAVGALKAQAPEHESARRALRLIRATGRRFPNPYSYGPGDLPADDTRAADMIGNDKRQSRRAARLLERYALADARPLAIGIRATRADGTPFHEGPYNEAHEVGKPATAPDWNPEPRCGHGLHYVPLVDTDGTVREADWCVTQAPRYSSTSNDVALWVVRADTHGAPMGAPEATQIDGSKAKARTLTPLARIAPAGASAMQRRMRAFSGWSHALEIERGKAASARVSVEHNQRMADRTAKALRDWRKG